jgi:hypothetical protein
VAVPTIDRVASIRGDAGVLCLKKVGDVGRSVQYHRTASRSSDRNGEVGSNPMDRRLLSSRGVPPCSSDS